MTFKQIITDLKNKVYHPVYVLSGEEGYYIDLISDYIESNILNETEKEFNQTIVYGEETNVSAIISYAKRYPMMANYQVVIVKEAQRVDNIDDLLPYVEKPLKSTILVICYKYKKIDGRKAFGKKAAEIGVLFDSPKFRDYKIPQWINEYVAEKGFKISPKASGILSDYLGNDLGKIVNEIEKIIISIPDKSEITQQHIFENIGISKDFNIFELYNAIGKKDVFKANQIINHFASNTKENSIIKSITMLNSWFNKLLIYHTVSNKFSNNEIAAEMSVNPYMLNDYVTAARNYSSNKIVSIISCLREFDLKAKGVESGISESQLYKEMLYKILH